MNRRPIAAAAAAIAAGLVWAPARAAVTVDGTRDAAYGNPLAVQTNGTGFGDNTDASGVTANGSELDAAYGLIQNGNLNLFFAGNLESNYNHLNVFIADGRAGQSTLNAGGSLSPMNGSKFSPGFAATYALDINGGGGPTTYYLNANDLTQTAGPSSYLGNFAPDGAAHAVGTSGLMAGLNNGNTAGVGGVDGNAGGAADATAAAAVATGFEISIPLAALGTPRGAIQVLADVNGGGNSYLSNQFLAGLQTTSGNVGSGNTPYGVAGSTSKFDFSAVPGQYFTVPAAVSTNKVGTWVNAAGGTWGTPANWANNVVPDAPGDVANFNASGAAPITVSLAQTRTVGQLTFNSATSYTLAGSPLVINDATDSLGVNPAITVNAGNHSIGSTVTMAAGLTVTTAAATRLSLTNPLAGTGPLVKAGPGTLALANFGTFTGNATVTAGTLELNDNVAASNATITLGDPASEGVSATLSVGRAGGVVVANPIVTALDGAGGNTLRSLAYTPATGTAAFVGPITLDGGLALRAPNGAGLTVAGVIADGTSTSVVARHDVTINPDVTGTATAGPSAAGAVALTAASTYTGTTTVNAGTLDLTTTGSLASPSVVVSPFAALLLEGTLSSTATLTSNGNTLVTAPTTAGRATRTLAALSIGAGAQVALSGGGSATRTVLVTSALTIAGTTGAWTGRLDLGGNDLVVRNGDLPTITDQARSGFAAPTVAAAFTGQGITSSTAAANAAHLTAVGVIPNVNANGAALYASFDGVAVTTADVLVRYTYFGDANLDGVVTAADYGRIDAGVVGQLTGWLNGDFNYDGVVDGSDYALIDNAFNHQTASVATPASAVAAVPEPASGLIAVAAVGGLVGRRRSRRHATGA